MERLEELKSQYIVHLANGSASDFPEYKKACGAVEGIALCEREFREMLSKLEGDNVPDGFSDLATLDS